MSKMVKVKTFNNYEKEPNFQRVKTFHNNYESDENVIKDFIKTNAKPEDIIPTLLPHLKNGITPQNSVKQVGYQIPKSQIPETNYIPQVQQDAIKRTRLKSLNIDTLETDIQKAGDEYTKVLKGWQDEKSLQSSKSIIENAYNRLKSYRAFLEDYGGDTEKLSKQINIYKNVLRDWDSLSNDYGKYKSSDEYESAVKQREKQSKISKDELDDAIKKAEELEYNVTVAQNGSQYSPAYSDNITKAKNALDEYLKKYGVNSVKELKGLKTKSITADNTKSLYQYQVEIDSLEYVITEAEAIDKKRVAAIRQKNSQAEWDALNEMKTLLGNNGYKTIDEARKALSTLKGERNALRTYKVGTGEFSEELTAITNPETIFYNENVEEYIEKGENTDRYKQYVFEDDEYRFLTKPEQRTLAYYIAKDEETGKNETEKFLKDLTETLNTREAKDYYKENLEDNTFLEILYAVPVGLDQFASGITNLFNTEDDYIPLSSTQIAGQLARSDLEEVKLPEWLGGFSLAGVAYDSLSTISNMAPSILASFVANAIVPGSGAVVGGVLLGGSAAGNAYQEALNNGMDKSQARTYSTLVGVSETLLSTTLSKVMGGKALSGKVQTAIDGIENGFVRFAANYGTAFVSEGMEEGIQEILTPFFENFALGYDKNGFEDIDWGEVAYSFLLGGLSGGLFETIGTVGGKVINHFANVSQVAETYNTGAKVLELIDFALKMPKESKAYKLAEKYNASSKADKKLSKNKLYNLAIASENVVADRLMQLGETNNVSAVANAVVKKLTGAELSVNDIEVLSKSSYGQEVLRTIVPKAESENTVETENSLQEGVGSDIIENNQETGVDINGSTNPELLAGREVSATNRGENYQRQYGANTEIIRISLGNAQQSTGISGKDVAAGESGWISARNFPFARTMGCGLDEDFLGSIQGVALKNIDSIGRIITPELQEKLSPTVFKTEEGTVISFFHWSPNSFNEFKFGDGAFHLGTLSAAITVKNRDAQQREGHILEGYVISKNPLITPDLGKFGAYSVCEFLSDKQIITEDELKKISQMEGFLSDGYDAPANVYVRELLKSMGYDTYLYQNLNEDLGSWSIGVFDAEQIVIIAENGVLKENSGVTEADTKVPANFMPETQNESDIDQEITDNDMYAKDPSQWSAENKNDTSVSKSFKEKLANLFEKNTDKKTTSISEIVKLIEKNFKVPISKGKFRQRAYGIYKNKSQAIRTKVSNALPTIAHELGHHLDNKYHLRNFESIGEAERVLKETRPDFYNSYKPMARPREAVAEFIRDYLADRNLAKEKYPFLFEEFERTLSEGGVEAKKDLENIKIIGDKINEYYTAELSERAKVAILTRKEAKKINRMGESLENVLLRTETEILDDAAIFKKISQKAYDLYYWAKKSSVRAKNTLAGYYMAGFNKDLVPYRDKDGKIVKDDNGDVVYVPALKFVLSEIENNDMLKEFNEYLVMRHGIEWLNYDLRVFADDSLNNKKFMQQRIKELENQYPQFKEVSENLYEWYRTFVYEYGVESGLMTKEQYQSLVKKYPCYVPFMRNVESKKGFAKSGLGNQNAPIKRAKGSGLEILSPIESLVIKTEQFMKAADRNAVMKEIADTADNENGFGWLLEEVPPDMIPNTISSDVIKSTAKKTLVNSGLDESAVDDFSNLVDVLIGESITDFKIGTIQGENIVAVRRNGKRTLYQIHDKNLLAALVGLQPNQFDVITKAMGKVTRVFKALTTGSNAVWSIVSNAPRDFDSAYKYGSENNPLKYTLDYVKAIISQTPLSKNKETLKLYRTLGGGYNNSFANAKELRLTVKELFKQSKNFTDRIKSVFNLVDNVAKLADFVETAPRLAEFKRVYERTGDAKKAMLAAEEVTVNFNRSGKFSKTLDQYLPYFNASLQANAKYAKTIANAFSKEGDKSFLVKSLVTAMIKAGITFGILGLFGDEGEEEYEKLSAYKKNNFYNIYLGDGKFFSIPKSQSTGVFDSLLERAFEISRKENVDWGKELGDFGDYMWLTFGPPLFDDVVVVGTALELASNEDFTGAPIVSSYYEDLVPEMQYNERTTYIAKFVGQLLGWSPMKIDHVIESNFGVFGLINKSVGKSEKDWTLGTKTKVFTDAAYSNDILNDFYDKAEEYSSKAKSYPDNSEYVYKDKQYTAIKSIVSALNQYGKDDPNVAREYKILARDYVYDFEKNSTIDEKLLKLLERSNNDDILFDRTFKPTYTINKVEYTMESEEFLELVEQYYKEVKTEYSEILEMNLSDETTIRLLTNAKKNVYEKVSKKYKVKR